MLEVPSLVALMSQLGSTATLAGSMRRQSPSQCPIMRSALWAGERRMVTSKHSLVFSTVKLIACGDAEAVTKV